MDFPRGPRDRAPSLRSLMPARSTYSQSVSLKSGEVAFHTVLKPGATTKQESAFAPSSYGATDTGSNRQEHDHRRAADGRVPACEPQLRAAPVDPECRDVVGSVIAHVHEIPGRLDGEMARVIAAGPLLGEQGQLSRAP